jgi:hypothetical protein
MQILLSLSSCRRAALIVADGLLVKKPKHSSASLGNRGVFVGVHGTFEVTEVKDCNLAHLSKKT